MGFGRTGRPAAPVAAGAAAEQDYDIPVLRDFTHYVSFGGGADDRACFKPFRDISRS